MPSVVVAETLPPPQSIPKPSSPSLKPKMAKLQIPEKVDILPNSSSASRLNQPLPPLPPLPLSPPSSPVLATLSPPQPQSRPPRSPPNGSSPLKPRALSYPTVTYPGIQLPPTVPEENPPASAHAGDGISPTTHAPLYRHASGSSPVLERNSANSRYSVRPRASTSASVARRNSRPFTATGELGESPVDEDAQRWTEEIRKKRESKRRWKEAEDEDRVIYGNKVDANHPNYITAYMMLTGVRVAVSRVSAKMDRPLKDEDFTFCQKFTFDYKGNELSPASKHDFRFKDYAPWVFRHLRSLFHLDPADYLISLTSRILLSELGSPGKSGSFFYFSRDYRFVIKTLHKHEHKYLRKILRLYYEHVKANPNTLISQFYGLHRVKAQGRKVHLVVINNVFPASKDIHQTFDLKGSTVGREFDESKLKENPRRPLKDLNWIKRNMSLEFGPRKKELLLTQLKKDVEFLASLNIMDYSLLLGIHYTSRGNAENIRGTTLNVYKPRQNPMGAGPARPGLQRSLSKRKQLEVLLTTEPRRLSASGWADAMLPTEEFLERRMGLFTSEEGGFYATDKNDQPTGEIIYYFGVIDLLTTYGVKKRLETWWKSFSHPRDQLSPIPPDEYAERFVKFIRANVRTNDAVFKEKPEEQQPASPLTTIEEQEDRRILERAHQQSHRENLPNIQKEQIDVGRSTVLTPDGEKPEQVLPKAIVRDRKEGSDSTLTEGVMVNGHKNFAEQRLVASPKQEISLERHEKLMQLQAEDNLRRQTT